MRTVQESPSSAEVEPRARSAGRMHGVSVLAAQLCACARTGDCAARIFGAYWVGEHTSAPSQAIMTAETVNVMRETRVAKVHCSAGQSYHSRRSLALQAGLRCSQIKHKQ
jgi:hypothetical protein